MLKHHVPYLWLVGVVAVIAFLVAAPFFGDLYLDFAQSESEISIEKKLAREEEVRQELHFSLLDPEQSPKNIHDTVIYGYQLMTDTHALLPKYVGNNLNCTHCHFAGGDTAGGKGGGISLAGIAALYPDYDERNDEVVTLQERINGCFRRSMNGLPLPLNSREMEAFVTYIHWISKDFPIYEEVPWRGLPKIIATTTPDSERGGEAYAMKCAPCHGSQGEGGVRIPPLWGSYSFNEGAGMNQLDTFASFIYHNMPFGDPKLSAEEAYDIAAFVTSRPRSKYPHKR